MCSSDLQSCALALGVIGDSDEDPTDKAIRAALMRVKDDLSDQQVRNFALIGLAQASGRPGHGAGDPIYGVNTKDKKENSRTFLLGELGKGKSAVKPWSGIAIAVMERELEDAKETASADMKLALRSELAARRRLKTTVPSPSPAASPRTREPRTRCCITSRTSRTSRLAGIRLSVWV